MGKSSLLSPEMVRWSARPSPTTLTAASSPLMAFLLTSSGDFKLFWCFGCTRLGITSYQSAPHVYIYQTKRLKCSKGLNTWAPEIVTGPSNRKLNDNIRVCLGKPTQSVEAILCLVVGTIHYWREWRSHPCHVQGFIPPHHSCERTLTMFDYSHQHISAIHVHQPNPITQIFIARIFGDVTRLQMIFMVSRLYANRQLPEPERLQEGKILSILSPRVSAILRSATDLAPIWLIIAGSWPVLIGILLFGISGIAFISHTTLRPRSHSDDGSWTCRQKARRWKLYQENSGIK